MLYLTRRPYEAIVITCPDGTQLQLVVASVDGSSVRLGIEAPKAFTVDRYEVDHRKKREATGEVLDGQEPRGPHWAEYQLRRAERESEGEY